MTATTPSASLVPVEPVFTDREGLALAGFLAGYRGLTRKAYALDLPSSAAGAGHGRFRCCSQSAAQISRPSPASAARVPRDVLSPVHLDPVADLWNPRRRSWANQRGLTYADIGI